MKQSRRKFVKTAVVGAGIGLSIPNLFAAYKEQNNWDEEMISVSENDVILFQGDSITDTGRDRSTDRPNDRAGLGGGYAFMAASELLLNHPNKNLKIYNRAISGNVVPQLVERWDEDCIDLKPDILSILIGVNDYWHTLDGDYKGTIKTYRQAYDSLLERTKNELPDVKLIIGEPYALEAGSAVTSDWFPEFDQYRHVAKELAHKYDALFIPYQDIYDKAIEAVNNAKYWSDDGVHPSLAGDALMAQSILGVLK